MPADLLDTARLKTHGQGTITILGDGLARMEQKCFSVRCCVHIEAEHHIKWILLKVPKKRSA